MKFISLHLLLFCATHSIVKSQKFTPKMIDCYICDDYKTSDCFSMTSKTHNETHDIVDFHGKWSNSMISVPCKGQESVISKCPGTCYIGYDKRCKNCKKRLFSNIFNAIRYQNLCYSNEKLSCAPHQSLSYRYNRTNLA